MRKQNWEITPRLLSQGEHSIGMKKFTNTTKQKDKPNLVCVYNITSAQVNNQRSVKLCKSLDNVKTIVINGSEISESNSYVFTKEGLNTVEFYLLDKTYIPENMFERISPLKQITLSESIISIENDAFFKSGLTSITIPKSVQNIKDGVFYLDYLETIILEEGNEYYYKENNCIIENSTNKLIKGFTDSIIPQSTIIIGKYAFSRCDFTSIIIPETVTIIEDHAFNGCFSLESITIPKAVTTLGDGAFSNCYNLSEIKSEAVITPTIGQSTFTDVYDEGILQYPKGSDYSSWLTALGNGWSDANALGMLSLTGVYQVSDLSAPTNLYDWEIDVDIFNSITIDDTLIDPKDIELGTYQFDTVGEHVVVFDLKDSEILPAGMFFDCVDLKAVYLPKQMFGIKDAAFNGCSNLSKIVMYYDSLHNIFDKSNTFVGINNSGVIRCYSSTYNRIKDELPSGWTWENI